VPRSTRPRLRTRRAMRSSGSPRKFTWVTVAAPLTTLGNGQTAYFELLTPVRPPTDITQEVYQNMTNPTIVAVYGHVTVLADRNFACGVEPPSNVTYGWGIYKDTDDFTPATARAPWSNGQSNLWMLHHTGYLQIVGQTDCDGVANNFGVNDLQYRRYELSQRKYKRRLDSQNDSLIFAVECAPFPFTEGGDLVVTAYFRMLLLE